MQKTIEGPLIFGDPKQIAFIKRIRHNDITKQKITIDYDKLLKVGVGKSEAEDLIKRLIAYRKRK